MVNIVEKSENDVEKIAGVIKRSTLLNIFASLARDKWLGALFTSTKNKG